jgi:hypothetical protein
MIISNRWEAFIQYLKEQILDKKEVLDQSSPVYTQVKHKKIFFGIKLNFIFS